MEQTEIERTGREIELILGALVGLCVVALVQMVSLPSLDVPLNFSLYGFATSVPVLSTAILCLREATDLRMRGGPVIGVLSLIGVVGSFTGVSGLFFHFAIYAGIVFIGASLIGLVIYFRYSSMLESYKKRENS